jgi:hypothetical protein
MAAPMSPACAMYELSPIVGLVMVPDVRLGLSRTGPFEPRKVAAPARHIAEPSWTKLNPSLVPSRFA